MTNEELAAEIRAWRGKVSARKAAERIGVPWRTLEYIEAGKGFRYPELLRIAMQAVRVEGEK
jgi:hypothetical protein